MTKYLLIILCVLTASCSSTKRMKKLIDKEPKEAALYISQAHPELLEPRSINFNHTYDIPLKVPVPEIKGESNFTPKDTCLKKFAAQDHNIKFEIDLEKGKWSYTILAREIDTVYKHTVDTVLDCPPCPQKSLLDFANKKLEKAEVELELKKKDVDYWRVRFFILCVIILIGIAFRFRKFLGVPI